MIVDRSGNEVVVGLLMDVLMNGMFTGEIIKVNENTVSLDGSPPKPPEIIVKFVLPMMIRPAGPGLFIIPGAYAVGNTVKTGQTGRKLD